MLGAWEGRASGRQGTPVELSLYTSPCQPSNMDDLHSCRFVLINTQKHGWWFTQMWEAFAASRT
jgi:hypothetical protein